jgi:quercetin dioxygenase-like cupin family protein
MSRPAGHQAGRDTLAHITSPLLARETTVGEVAACVARLEALLDRHTPFRHAASIVEGESWLPQGWAVSPTQAAMCARDYRRTHAFALGLSSAVAEAGAGLERPVRVLYAGCGPWALLALPVMAAAPASAVRFTLLDVHQENVDSVAALVASLDLTDRVEAIARADAAAWVIPDGQAPDVILIEAMNVALEKEPQVAITRHLVAQAPGAILVPRAVRVDARLVDPSRERTRVTAEGESDPPEPDRVEMGTVFELSRETAAAWQDVEAGSLPAGRVRMPPAPDPRRVPRLFTRIETFGGERLDAYDSWLTAPRPFPGGLLPRPGSVVTFRYELGASPRLAAAEWPDRLRLPLAFDPVRLESSLEQLEAVEWTGHFVTGNYEGRWSVIPLRAPAGTEHQHPILQITSNPGTTAFVDTPAVDRAPYLREVLAALGGPLGAARLMRLDPGSIIKTHTDPDLAFEDGWARLHIPIRTNPQVSFLLNGEAVVMQPGECWYLRLSDPHSVRNDGAAPRVHLVIDAPVGAALEALFAQAREAAAGEPAADRQVTR